MAIQFTCTACGQPIEVDDEMAGQAVTCPYCRKAVTTPATSTLDAGGAPPAAETVEPAGVEARSYASATPPPKKSVLGWISLACIVAAVLCSLYARSAFQPITTGLNMRPKTQQEREEVSKALQERLTGRPGLLILGFTGGCALPLAGVICAIVTLAKRWRPRWPAIVGLCIIGGLLLLQCVGVLFRGGLGLPGSGG